MAGLVPGGAPVNAQSIVNGYYVCFAVTFVYDNGFESGMTQFSPPVYADGRKYYNISSIPTGPTVGGHLCVKRRVWQWIDFAGPVFTGGGTKSLAAAGDPSAGSPGAAGVYCDINDNVTAQVIAFSDPSKVTATSGNPNVVNASVFGDTKPLPNVATVPGPTNTLSVILEAAVNYGFDPGYDVLAGTALTNSPATNVIVPSVLRSIRYSWIYANGVESDWSPAQVLDIGLGAISFGVGVSGSSPGLNSMPLIKGLLTGPSVNSVPVIGCIVYCSFSTDWEPGHYIGCVLVPSNGGSPFQGTQAYQPQFYTSCGRSNKLATTANSGKTTNSGSTPTWPNPDGPSLETDPPDDLTDTNPDLIAEDSSQRLIVTTDLSQVRNRIHVQGAGSQLALAAKAGDTVLTVKDVTAFPSGTGQLYVDGLVVQFNGVTFTDLSSSAGTITLTSGMPRAVAEGATVCNYLKVDDPKSQATLGQIEFDVNGNSTDGVHEYTVQDGTLTDTFSMFMAANAQLEVFSQPVVTIQYATRDTKSRVGQFVKANMTSPPCVGTFLIQSVTIDQVHDESDQIGPRYTVTATTAKFTLDDLLLQIAPRSSSGGGGAGGGGGSVQGASSSSIPSISQQLDALGTDQGDILYRDVTGWQVLKAGVAGQILETNGPGFNPQWVDNSSSGETTLTGTGNPQGVTTGSLGQEYRDTLTGNRWRKMGGAATAYGWYPIIAVGSGNPNGKLYGNWLVNTGNQTSSGTPLNSFTGSGADGFFGANNAGSFWSTTSITSTQAQIVNSREYITATSAATSGTTFYINSTGLTNPLAYLDDEFDISVEFLTGSDVTNIRLWPIMIGHSALQNSDTPYSGNAVGAVGIRFSTAAGDAGFVGYVLNAAGASTITAALAGGTVTATTVYKLRIRFVRAGTPTVYFSVNDGVETAVTTTVPATGQTYNILIGATTLANAAKTWGIRSVGACWGA